MGAGRSVKMCFVAHSDGTPFSRIRDAGYKSAHPFDLLTVAISPEEKDAISAEIRAREFFKAAGSIHSIGDVSFDQIRSLTGWEDWSIHQALCWIELGRRSAHAGAGEVISLMNPEAVRGILSDLQSERREHFVVLLLDSKNGLMKRSTIHIGTLTTSLVGPREVFREVIREGASSMIIAHNHPSGDPSPSEEDIAITKKLVALGKELDIPIHDHVIIGRVGVNGGPGYYSFKREGLMENS